jgi:hypothetical protein
MASTKKTFLPRVALVQLLGRGGSSDPHAACGDPEKPDAHGVMSHEYATQSACSLSSRW